MYNLCVYEQRSLHHRKKTHDQSGTLVDNLFSNVSKCILLIEKYTHVFESIFILVIVTF